MAFCIFSPIILYYQPTKIITPSFYFFIAKICVLITEKLGNATKQKDGNENTSADIKDVYVFFFKDKWGTWNAPFAPCSLPSLVIWGCQDLALWFPP
jgi:hypothetical protein